MNTTSYWFFTSTWFCSTFLFHPQKADCKDNVKYLFLKEYLFDKQQEPLF